jgi:hypothetical protein
MTVPEILTLFFFLPLSISSHVVTARYEHTSVVLSDGSVLVMGGYDGSPKNDVWKTVDGGASWILVTSSAGWTGKKILHLTNLLPILSSLGEDTRRCHRFSVSRVCFTDVQNPSCHDYLEPHILLAIAKLNVSFYLMRLFFLIVFFILLI